VTAVLAFLLMLMIVAAMAVGVMFGRKPISGSCGGMKALGMNVECEICGGDPNACDNARTPRLPARGRAAADLATDATVSRPDRRGEDTKRSL
jgi:uncharacterized protein